MAIYANTYLVSQAYGGPEEGGWWYETGEPIQSIIIDKDADLDELSDRRDEKSRLLNDRYEKVVQYIKQCDSAEKEQKADRLIKKIEKREDDLWLTGTLAEYRKLALRINEQVMSDKPIEHNPGEFGGYTFVLSSKDDEDPTPSTYRGDDSYRTVLESHFAEYYPQERPTYC